MDSSLGMEELDDIDISQIEDEISSLYEEIKGAVSEDELSNSEEEPVVNRVINEGSYQKVSEKSPPETSAIDDLQDSSSRNENSGLRNRDGNKRQEFCDASQVHLKNINVENTSLRERTKDEKETSTEDSLTSNNKENISLKGVVSNEEEPSDDIFQVESEERKSCGEESKKEGNDQDFPASLINKTNLCLDSGLNILPHEKQLANKGVVSGKTIDADEISTDRKNHQIVHKILNKSKRSVDNLRKCKRKEFAKVANRKKSSGYKKVNVILKMLCKLFVTHLQNVPNHLADFQIIVCWKLGGTIHLRNCQNGLSITFL